MTCIYLNSTPANYHSAWSFWTSPSKKTSSRAVFSSFSKTEMEVSFLWCLWKQDTAIITIDLFQASRVFCGLARVSLVQNCEITAVVPFAPVPVFRYFSYNVIMGRNDDFSTAYFNSGIEWMKRCPGVLEKVATLLERWAAFCLPSLSLNSKRSPSALPLTSFCIGIYTNFTLQNQSSHWRSTVVTRSCSSLAVLQGHLFQRSRVWIDAIKGGRKLFCVPSVLPFFHSSPCYVFP